MFGWACTQAVSPGPRRRPKASALRDLAEAAFELAAEPSRIAGFQLLHPHGLVELPATAPSQ